MWEALQADFIRNALAAGILVSIVCGVIGTLVVVNRIVFLAGGIAHAAYGGIGLAFFLGWPYVAGTTAVSLLSAGVMAAVTLKARHRADAMVGVIWAVGMAVGVILLDLSPGYNADLMSYLFGSILTVPASDLWQMALLGAAVLAVVTWYYNDFLAMSYDDEFARLRNVPVTFLYCLLLGMVALAVVMIIRVVGLILVIALLTIPPFIAERFTGSLRAMMIASSLLSCLFTVVGFWLSYAMNLTSGATIILVAAAGFFLSILWERRRRRAGARDGKPA
ncbi:MAG: Manganese transport system membrane protein MntB [Syntrophaceae bacterium PtaU1.Bin231]|nr:MAG: Manganese transport system membrane protein MntB [Syntrophaceae bacterium PtaU1.Bin231]HOG16426.1 metal ABC transporter permease [Syntrophales bacterium]